MGLPLSLACIILFITSCGSSSVPDVPDVLLVEQQMGNDVTALVVTNISGLRNGVAEPVGSLPSPSTAISKNGSLIQEPPTAYIRGRNLLTGSTPNRRDITILRKTRSARGLSEEDTSYSFYAYDNDDELITVTASLEYGATDSKCLIYVQDSYNGEFSDWSSIGKFFDNTVSPAMLTGFGNPTDVDSNGKVVILYYDMQDNRYMGFFYSVDLFSQEDLDEYYPTEGYTSNEMEIFYMNYNWSVSEENPEPIPDDAEMLRTLPHEFQHMINFGSRFLNGNSTMDTWIDEALAESAEHYTLKTPGLSRIDWFNQDYYGNIRNGLGLCVWENTIGNYSLSYTFMQYLRIHSKSGHTLYKKLIDTPDGSYHGLTTVMKEENRYFTDFKTILLSYRMANLLQQPDNIYGYLDENSTFKLTVQSPITPVSAISLKPGGSIAIMTEWDSIQTATGAGRGENINLTSVREGIVIDQDL
ncbi:MAG: hypothetical protein PF637_08750 [Spirochaetes bacterium]|jgi:hypothetical protein|nr:hypothetical protein [Spirochaetota bacterium]